MKKFLKRYSYNIVMVFLFHLVFGIFGLACVSFFSGDKAKIGLSIFCIAFLMFLLYGEMWKLAGQDTAAGYKSSPIHGLFIGIAGSAIDIILLIFKILTVIFPKSLEWMEGVVVLVNFIYNGFMRGFMIITLSDGTTQFGSTVWFFLVTALPCIISSGLGYYMGSRNAHLTNFFVPVNPEEQEIRKEKKEKRKGGNGRE